MEQWCFGSIMMIKVNANITILTQPLSQLYVCLIRTFLQDMLTTVWWPFQEDSDRSPTTTKNNGYCDYCVWQLFRAISIYQLTHNSHCFFLVSFDVMLTTSRKAEQSGSRLTGIYLSFDDFFTWNRPPNYYTFIKRSFKLNNNEAIWNYSIWNSASLQHCHPEGIALETTNSI